MPDAIGVLRHVPWWGWLLWQAAYFRFSIYSATWEAPTAASSLRYRRGFRALNIMAGNLRRAQLWNRGIQGAEVGRRWNDTTYPQGCAAIGTLGSTVAECTHEMRNLQTLLIEQLRRERGTEGLKP